MAKSFTLRVELLDAPLPVWRSITVPGSTTLERLHLIVQVAMGWEVCHAHQFTRPRGKGRPATVFAIDADPHTGTHEADVRLDQVVKKVGSKLHYEYDFGDGWQHLLAVTKTTVTTDQQIRCLDGHGACPPEDCGGVWGYADILRALSRPADLDEDEHELLTWLPEEFDPAAFDVESTDRALQAIRPSDADQITNTVPAAVLPLMTMPTPPPSDLLAMLGAARLDADASDPAPDVAAHLVHPWVALLHEIGAGIKLTEAGYLPPSRVKTLFDELDLDPELLAPGHREERTLPIADLHSSARALGLVRTERGKLVATAAGRRLAGDPDALITTGNPIGLLHHIEARLPLESSDVGGQSAVLLLLAVARGLSPEAGFAAAADILTALGWRTVDDGPVDPVAVVHSADQTSAVLELLHHQAGTPDDVPTAEVVRDVARRALRHDGLVPLPTGPDDPQDIADADPMDLLPDMTMALADVVAQARNPLDAEVSLCAAYSGMSVDLPGDVGDDELSDATTFLVSEVVGYAEEMGDDGAVGLLRATAAVGPEATRSIARAAAERLVARGAPDPPWADGIGAPNLSDAWHYGDLLGQQTTLGMVFDYKHHDHAVMVLIDHSLGGGVKDCWVANGERVETLRREVARQERSWDGSFFETVEAARAAELLDAALAQPACPVDLDQIDDVARYLPLLRARADHLHTIL